MEWSSAQGLARLKQHRAATGQLIPLACSLESPNSMIPEPHEPFDINRKDDSIFLLGSMFTVIFLFLL